MSFKLKFLPDRDQDYSTQIICITEREKFTIPIECYGSRAILNMPDEIVFDNSSVRFPNERVVLVGNVGFRAAKVMFECDLPFNISPKQVILAPMENVQLKINYEPKDMRYSDGTLKVKYETGEEMHVRLLGMPVEQDITLDVKKLHVKPSFIGCATENRFKIINKSSITAPFSWKFFFDDEEEAKYREKKISEIVKYGQAKVEQKVSAEHVVERNKMQNAIDTVQQNPLLFEDSTFLVEPKEGIVWPNSSLDVQVIFKPSHVGVHSATMYLDISGKASRIPLKLTGEANGPRARFSSPEINMGQVYVNSDNTCEVEIENFGEIDFFFNTVLDESSVFQSSLQIEPDSGMLAPGSKVSLTFNLNSSILGNFDEDILFEIKHMDDPLILKLKAKVIGPTFSLNSPVIYFGDISCADLARKEFILTNTSSLSVDFDMRIESIDYPHQAACFKLHPECGFLDPGEDMIVQIEYSPTQSLNFIGQLLIDCNGIGQAIASFDIKAKVVPPEIKAELSVIHFGDVYIGHTYTQKIRFYNDSKMSGRLLIPKQRSLNDIFSYEAENHELYIPAKTNAEFFVKFTAKSVSFIRHKLFFTVRGAADIELELHANGIGPTVILSTPVLDWDKIPVLTEKSMDFTIENTSPIDAPFSTSIENDVGAFEIVPGSGVIPPNSIGTFTVKAFLKDSTVFDSSLIFNFEPSVRKILALTAKGIGITIAAKNIPKKCDFGSVICKRASSRTFVLTNHGKRAQSLIWISEKHPRSLRDSNFLVNPTRCVLPSGESVEISITAYKDVPFEDADVFTCLSSFEGLHSRREIFVVDVSAKFVEPIIIASKPDISLSVSSNPDGVIDAVMSELILTNITGIPLTAKLTCESPFSIVPDIEFHKFDVDQEKKIMVKFDPNLLTSRISFNTASTITVSFAEHEKKFAYSVFGSATFPNAKLSCDMLDFGLIDVNQLGIQRVNITNTGQLKVDFLWESSDRDLASKDAHLQILPNSGSLSPGQTETLVVRCKMLTQNLLKTSVYCHIKGGPSYVLDVLAHSNKMDMLVSPRELNFGELDFNMISSKEIVCHNPTNSPLSFSTHFGEDLISGHVAVRPCEGVIEPQKSIVLLVSFCSKIPAKVNGQFVIKFGNTTRVPVLYSGVGKLLLCESKQLSCQLVSPVGVAKTKPSLFEELKYWLGTGRYDFESGDVAKVVVDEMEVMKCEVDNVLRKLDGQSSYGSKLLLNKIDDSLACNKKLTYVPELTDFTLKEYQCNFGVVIVDREAKKAFQINNLPSSHPKLHKEDGFDKFFSFNVLSRDDNSITVEIIVKPVQLGLVSKKFWFESPGSPKVVFACTADISIPKLNVSSSIIDFGSVSYGYRKKNLIALTNVNTEDFKWELTLDASESGNCSFYFEPNSGVIAPGESQSIFGIFEPKDAGEKHAIFKFANLSNQDTIQMMGSSDILKFEIEPRCVDFMNALPYGDAVESKLKVKNVNPFPVEFLLPDVDLVYTEEYKKFEIAFGDKPAYFQVKATGGSFKQALEFHENLLEFSHNNNGLPRVEEDASDSPVESSRRTKSFFIVFGSKLSGKSEICKNLCEEHKLPLISSTEILAKTPKSIDSFEDSYFSELDGIIHGAGFKNGFIIEVGDIKIGSSKFVQKLLSLLPESSVLHCFIVRSAPSMLREKEEDEIKIELQQLAEVKMKLFRVDDSLYEQFSAEEKDIFDTAMKKIKENIMKVEAKRTHRSKQSNADKRKPNKLAKDKTQLDNNKDLSSSGLDEYDNDYESGRKYVQPIIDLAASVEAPDEPLGSVARSSDITGSKKKLNSFGDIRKNYCLSKNLKKCFGDDLATVVVHDLSCSWTMNETMKSISDAIASAQLEINSSESANLDRFDGSILEQRFKLRKPVDRLQLFGLTAEWEAGDDATDSNPSLEVTKTSNQTKQNASKPANSKRPKSAEETCRVTIKPNESRDLKVRVLPSTTGKTDFSLNIAAFGYDTLYSVPCRIFCSPPLIEISVNNVQGTKINFGSVIVDRPKEKNKLPDIPDKSFVVKNTCVSRIKGGIFFKLDSKSEFCRFEPATFDLSPNESVSISVHIQPKSAGVFMEQLILCVKDNPHVYCVQIDGTAHVPALDISPAHVQFDRIILNRAVKRTLEMKNPTPVPIYWRVLSEFPDEVSISSRHGKILPQDTTNVLFGFQSPKPVAVTKRSFRVEYSLNENFVDNLYSELLALSAEAYDVLLDLHLPRGNDTCIDFGLLMVTEEAKQSCILRNKGKYDISFKFDIDELYPMITANPSEGVIHTGDKAVSVSFVLRSDRKLVIEELEIIKCSIFDPVTKEKIGMIPLKVTSRCEFAQLTFTPSRDLPFGSIQVGSKQTKSFSMFNPGPFDLTFDIGKNRVKVDSQTLEEKSNLPQIITRAIPNKKEKEEVLLIRNLILSPFSGNLVAGSKIVINVELTADSTGIIDEPIHVDIGDRLLDPSSTSVYKVTGEICAPEICVRDLDNYFAQQEYAEKFCSILPGYVPSNTVNFGLCMLQKLKKVNFMLENVSGIPLELNCAIVLKKGANKVETSELGFEVDTTQPIILNPLQQKNVSVTFSPINMQIYYCAFQASVTGFPEKSISFDLAGEGCLPRVTVSGTSTASKGYHTVKFLAGSIGTVVQKTINLRNEGLFDATVRLEWGSSGKKDFDITNSVTQYFVKASDSVVVPILYNANTIEASEAELNVYNVDNPFENLIVKCNGSIQQRTDLIVEDYKGENEGITLYNLTIGDSSKTSFKLRNLTKSNLRVEWQPLANIEIVPPVVILGALLSKDILINVTPKVPESQNVVIIGKVNEVRLITRKAALKDEAHALPNGNSEENASDMAYEIVKDHEDFNVNLSYSSVYTQFECPLNDIKMPATFIRQVRRATIPIRNIGENNIKFYCKIEGNTHGYFKVLPSSGVIGAGEYFEVELFYRPVETGEHSMRLLFDMGNLSPNAKPLSINVSASARKPICFFESDLFTSNHFTPANFIENQFLDASAKNIRILTCGKNQVTNFTVRIVNQFKEPLSLVLTNKYAKMTLLRCLREKSTVDPGNVIEIPFEHISSNIGELEYFWNLLVMPFNIQVPFCINAITRDMKVFFKESFLEFGSRPIGSSVSKTVKLFNQEDESVDFSLETILHGKYLSVDQVSGKIPPLSEKKITITFNSVDEDVFKTTLVWNIAKKISPLSLVVSASGFSEKVKLLLEHQNNNFQSIENENVALKIHSFFVDDNYTRKFVISNDGFKECPFKWNLISSGAEIAELTSRSGSVKGGEKEICVLRLSNHKSGLIDVTATLVLGENKKFNIRFTGECRNPRIGLPNERVTFNSCYPFFDGNKVEQKVIEIHNSEDTDFVLEHKPLESAVFSTQFEKEVLPANKSVRLFVYFRPTASGLYNEQLHLLIGNVSKTVLLEGRCIDYDISVFRDEMRTVRVENVVPGATAVKTVRISNKTGLSVSFNFGPENTISEMEKYGIKINSGTSFQLRPKEASNVDISFSPMARVSAFRYSIYAYLPGKSIHLFDITGNSPQVDVYLSTEHVDFGNVVRTCRPIVKLRLENRGDLPARFKWKNEKMSLFGFEPNEGSIGPKSSKTIDVIFTPGNEIKTFTKSAECFIPGNSRPLKVSLTGTSIEIPPPAELLKFVTPVRRADIKTVTFSNNTATRWLLRPVIDNKLWAGADLVEVMPGASHVYKITYSPTIMTKEDRPDSGILFIPFPTGNAVSYTLQGLSQSPLAESTITKEIETRSRCEIDIPILNDSQKLRRFKINNLYDTANPLISVEGADHVDVPAFQSRNHHVYFTAFKAGSYKIQVKVIDESNEFWLFDLAFSVKASVKSIPIQMITPVRRTITKEITLSNPSGMATTYNISCENPEIYTPAQMAVAAKGETTFVIQYMPLSQKETNDQLVCASPDLGTVCYNLRLTGIEPSLEKSMGFSCCIGQSQIQVFKFTHYAKTKTDFTCKIDNADFTIEKTISVPPANPEGSEVSIDVTYEPSRLGQSMGFLAVTSPVAGDYFCQIAGQCNPPKPQGPFIIRPGVNHNVCLFKNVYHTSVTYAFSIDHTAFVVKPSETIGPKKVFPVSINYKPQPQNPVKATKLNITHPNGLSWQFYIRIQDAAPTGK